MDSLAGWSKSDVAHDQFPRPAGIAVSVDKARFLHGPATIPQSAASICMMAWSCVDQSTSESLHRDPNEAKVNTEGMHGLGSPVSTNDIVLTLVARDSAEQPDSFLSALDVITGRPLWQTRIAGKSVGGPIVDGLKVLIPQRNGVAVHSLIDGSLIDRRLDGIPTTDGQQAVVGWLHDEFGRVVMPSVSQNGRVYVATDRGRIFCLGARHPW